MKKLLPILFLIGSHCFAEKTIEVYQSSMKITGMGEEKMYFGFSAGDKIVFNFQELDRKELKEVEIFEFPGNSKFMDYKTKAIVNKTIEVQTTGIFCFRFTNGALTGRICSIKIDRIPKDSSTFTFNTNVFWKTVQDTTIKSRAERYLIKRDTSVVNVMDQIAKVHSVGNANGNRTDLNFKLPENTKFWSYYIGVDQAGQQAYREAVNQITELASPLVKRLAGYNPLAALALGLPDYLAQAQIGEDIDYYILENENINLYNSGQQFYYTFKGKVINAYARVGKANFGNYFVCLKNDNAVTGVTVSVKVTAIVINEEWGVRTIEFPSITERSVPYLKD